MTIAELVQGLARGAHIAATMSVFGAAMFQSAIVVPVSRANPVEMMRLSNSRVIPLVYLGLAISIVAACLWLLSQAADLAEDGLDQLLATLPIVLFQTRFGIVLMIRLALIAAAAVMLARIRNSWGSQAATVLAASAVALEAALGHGASMEGGLGWTLIVIEALHLLAAGAWLGGLIPLLLFLHSMSPREAQATVLRFSRVGLICVTTLAGTIVVQGWILVGGVPGLIGTDYGLLALAKLGLFLALLGIACLNRFRYTRALAGQTGPDAKRRLQRSVAVETLVGLCAVLVAGVLLTQPPAMHQQPRWPFPYQLSLVTQSDPDLRNETLLGATLAILAFAFLCLALASRGARLIALAAAVGFGWLSWPHLSLLLIPAYPTSFYHSPTGFTAASIARGKELFAQHCTGCHGEEGRGNGPLAKNLPIPPADLTAEHLFGHSDGEMFWWLSHGIEGPDGSLAMPGLADVLEEDDRWGLIDYVRAHNAGLAIANGDQPAAPIAAPDIAVSLDGRTVSLSRLRGRFLIVAASRDGGKTLPPPLPPLGDTEVTVVPVMPESDDWTAYAIAGGIAPAELEGTEFLVDPEGWLRVAMRPDTGMAWPRPDNVVAWIKDAQAHPLMSDEATMQHHH